MKTEDLKNYIFEQLNETSNALKGKLEDGRYEQAIRALRTGNDIRRENLKMSEKTGRLDPSLTTVADIMSDKGDKATKSYLKANNWRKGRRGDGSERTSKQESAFNFINGLKRLTETSDALKKKLEDGRRKQANQAYDTSNHIFKEWEKIYKRTGKFDQNLDTVRKFMGDKATKLATSVDKARNRRNGLKGDGSPGTSTQELEENSRRRKDANNSAQQKRYGWTHKDTRVQDYADKMYPEPDDVSEFENEQLQGRRNEAELALRRREDPHNIKKNIRDMLFTIKK